MREIVRNIRMKDLCKIAFAVLFTVMAVFAAGWISFAENDTCTLGDAGTFDDGSLKYAETAEGEVKVTGYLTAPVGHLTIPSSVENGGKTYTVTAVAGALTPAAGVFYMCTGITSVTIPDTVTEIGHFAFYKCTEMASADLGSVGTIGFYAFFDTGLTSVTIPGSVTSVGSYAFSECKKLETVTMDGSPVIGLRMFTDCKKLTSVDLGSVTVITGESFSRSGLTSVTIPDTVRTIETFAFMECDDLNTVTIPDSVTDIGQMAFGYGGLKAAAVPSGTYIDYGAFKSALTPYKSALMVYYSEAPSVTAVVNGDGTIGLIITAPAGKTIERATVTNAVLGEIDAVYDSGLWSFDPSGEWEFVLSLTLEDIVVPDPDAGDDTDDDDTSGTEEVTEASADAGKGAGWWPLAFIATAAFFFMLWVRSRHTVTVTAENGCEGLAGVCVQYTINGVQGSLITSSTGSSIIPARAGSEVVIISAAKEGCAVSDVVVISGDVRSSPEGALVSVTAERGTRLNLTLSEQ